MLAVRCKLSPQTSEPDLVASQTSRMQLECAWRNKQRTQVEEYQDTAMLQEHRRRRTCHEVSEKAAAKPQNGDVSTQAWAHSQRHQAIYANPPSALAPPKQEHQVRQQQAAPLALAPLSQHDQPLAKRKAPPKHSPPPANQSPRKELPTANGTATVQPKSPARIAVAPSNPTAQRPQPRPPSRTPTRTPALRLRPPAFPGVRQMVQVIGGGATHNLLLMTTMTRKVRRIIRCIVSASVRHSVR